MTDNTKMRESFEKWAKMRVPYRALKELDDEGEYDDQEVRMMWCAWQAAQSVPVGMRVSVDTSTGEHDAGNRVFAVVTGQQDDGRGGLILLCEEESRNFEQAVPVIGEALLYALVKDGSVKFSCESAEVLTRNKNIHGYELVPLHAKPPTSITQAELDAKDARIVRQHRQIIEEMVRTEAVKQELDALRKDAERYRWIKLHANVIEWHLQDEDGTRLHERPTLDADIDRAMVAK